MKNLIFSAVFLAMCSVCYAGTAVLVYTINQQADPWLMDTNDISLVVANVKTNFKIQGALIVDVNTETLETIVPDADQTPALIILGKDADGSRVNYTLTGDADSIIFVKKVNVNAKAAFVTANWYFGDTDWYLSTVGSVGAYGKMASVVIAKGSTTKVSVPQTLRGIGTLQKGSSDPLFMAGVGDGVVTATLNTNITRQVNEGGNGTVMAAIALIQRSLPPSPNPLTWVIKPRETIAGGNYYHTMQCCEVIDANPPILYQFVCVDNPSISSGWQEGTTYTRSVGGGTHYYRWYVIAKDGFGNMTGKGNTIWVAR